MPYKWTRVSTRDIGAGWVDVTALLAACTDSGTPLSRTDLEELVAGSDKQRFALDSSSDRIRAQQGHSIPVTLGLTAQASPTVLYHGTVARFLPSITSGGLTRQARHHVHLSADPATARRASAAFGKVSASGGGGGRPCRSRRLKRITPVHRAARERPQADPLADPRTTS